MDRSKAHTKSESINTNTHQALMFINKCYDKLLPSKHHVVTQNGKIPTHEAFPCLNPMPINLGIILIFACVPQYTNHACYEV